MNQNDIMAHAVTAYDRRRANRKGYNPYALAQYLIRGDEVLIQAKTMGLRAAICTGFNDRLRDAVLKAFSLEPYEGL